MSALPLRFFLITLAQTALRIMAYCLQQPVTSLAIGRFRRYQALVDQRGKEVEQLHFSNAVAGAPVLRRVQRPATGEHRQSTQQCLLGGAHEVVAPIEHRAQRPLTRYRSA